MKWDCNKRFDRLHKWHRWFAWYPVSLGHNDCRWLETVYRKGTWYSTPFTSYWTWEYKKCKN